MIRLLIALFIIFFSGFACTATIPTNPGSEIKIGSEVEREHILSYEPKYEVEQFIPTSQAPIIQI